MKIVLLYVLLKNAGEACSFCYSGRGWLQTEGIPVAGATANQLIARVAPDRVRAARGYAKRVWSSQDLGAHRAAVLQIVVTAGGAVACRPTEHV